MAANNPFSPFAATNPTGAPQIQGIQMPNVPMQGKQPGLMEQVGPKVFEKAMNSGPVSDMGTAAGDSLKGVFSGLMTPAGIATTAGTNTALATGMAGGAEAAIASQALASGTAAAGTAATAGGALASAAPMAAALGPLGIPVLIGAGLMAAGGGK